MELKRLQKEYTEKAQYAYRQGDDGEYLHWDNKAVSIYYEIDKVNGMECNDLVLIRKKIRHRPSCRSAEILPQYGTQWFTVAP